MAKAKAYQFQKDGVRALERFIRQGQGALLGDDMGLGKTLQALWLLKRSKAGPMLPALVVCPASVKYSWEHSALQHVGLRSQVLEGRTPPSGRTLVAPVDLLVINPDILTGWLPWLRRLGLNTVVLDECQYFQNPRAKRTKAALDLCREVPYKLALSGTPLTNRPAELWPVLHMLRPDLWPSFLAFAHRHCDPKKKKWGWVYQGAERIPELNRQLRENVMVRRMKKDHLPGLPDKVRSVTPMDISDRAEYNAANGDFLKWLANTQGKHVARKAKKAEQIARIGYLLRLTARLKARAVVEWANMWLEANPGEKLVLFAIHKKMIQVLQRRIGAKSVTVDGSVTGRRRSLAVQQFRNDPGTRVFIGNIKAAGTGLDGLQGVCNTLAFAELWWRPGDHVQAEDRIYRIGSTETAWIYYLVAGGTIEEKLAKILQEKQKVIHGVLDGEALIDSIDILDQLMAAVA